MKNKTTILIMFLFVLFVVSLCSYSIAKGQSVSDTVYATGNGTKYHKYKECQYLKRSKIVVAVNVADIGHLAPCSACYREDKTEQADSIKIEVLKSLINESFPEESEDMKLTILDFSWKIINL